MIEFRDKTSSGNNKHLIFFISVCPITHYTNDVSPIFAWLPRPFLVVLGKQPIIKGPGFCFHGNCVYVCVCVCTCMPVCVFNKMIEIVTKVQKSILHWLAENIVFVFNDMNLQWKHNMHRPRYDASAFYLIVTKYVVCDAGQYTWRSTK